MEYKKIFAVTKELFIICLAKQKPSVLLPHLGRKAI